MKDMDSGDARFRERERYDNNTDTAVVQSAARQASAHFLPANPHPPLATLLTCYMLTRPRKTLIRQTQPRISEIRCLAPAGMSPFEQAWSWSVLTIGSFEKSLLSHHCCRLD